MSLQKLIETQALAYKLLSEIEDGRLAKEGWTFRFSNRKTQVGTCFYDRKEIVFSKHYVESHPDEVEDTLRHEIAHALVGPKHGHDHVWRRKAIEIGARPERCADESVKFNGNYNYLVVCPNCDSRWRRHRIKQMMWYARCPNCEVYDGDKDEMIHPRLIVVNLKTGDVFNAESV